MPNQKQLVAFTLGMAAGYYLVPRIMARLRGE